jgi:hypothetical protein
VHLQKVSVIRFASAVTTARTMWGIQYAVEELDVARLQDERVRPEPGRDIKCAATTRYATGNATCIPEMPRFAIIIATNGIDPAGKAKIVRCTPSGL